MAVIEVQNLTKRFGALAAVDHLSFEVDAGTVVGFLGPNGAGKTTTLRMLLGLVEPSEGAATICGRPYRELADPLHRGRARCWKPPAPTPAAPPATICGSRPWPAGCPQVGSTKSSSWSVSPKRPTGAWASSPSGMRQRLGLATALLCDPEILVLDEPANGLDPEGVRWLREVLRGLAAEGRTVLVSSHILAEVAQTVDSVVILDRGRLVTHDTLDELTARTSTSCASGRRRPSGCRAADRQGATAVLVAPTGSK